MADPNLEPLSPLWWVARLYTKLVARRVEIDWYDAYYRGEHPLPWLAPQARDEFRRILRMTRSNYMGLVVDAMVERLQVEGFRLGRDADDADKESWRVWQANGLDSAFDQALLEAAITGAAYLMVAPNPDDERTPLITVEHPSQAIVEYQPGSSRRRRKAGLKVFEDDWTGLLNATLQVDGYLFKWEAPVPKVGDGSSPRWVERRVPGEDWPARNPLDVVTLIEVPNNPRLLTGGVSELSDVTDIQDRVNKTIADRLITQDYGAFPQKWATAWPEYQDAARTVPSDPIDIGRNRMVTTEVAETKFGQWVAAPLDPYSAAKQEDVKDIASRTRTPPQYLLGEMVNVNGETLKAGESGLVSKCWQRIRTYEDGPEESVQLARRAAGLPGAGVELETIWRDPQYRTPAEQADPTIKLYGAGIVSLRQAREDMGYSQTQIARMEEQDAEAGESDPMVAATRMLASQGVTAGAVPQRSQTVPGAPTSNT